MMKEELGFKSNAAQDTKSDKENKSNNLVDCDKVKSMLLKIFLCVRYYIDLLIDCAFGYFKDSKRQFIKKCSNPIILESATSLARKIRKRELTSEQVVQAFIDRIKEVNPVLNAVVDSRYEEALREAKEIDEDIRNGTIQDVDFQTKPFLGVPFTTKESTAVKGLSYTFGLVPRKGKKASFDADYIKLMKEAGAICLGVTNIPQLNLWQETHNPIYGITNNPYNTTRNVGGSSGGEASILAAGGTAISLGTDIGGSIRIPAFMCGVFGHKPTSHLISTKGMTFRTGKEEQTLVVAGLLSRHADDLVPILKVLVAENANKLKLDQSVDIQKIKIFFVSKTNDFSVSPFRQEMKTILARAVNHFQEILGDAPEEVQFEGTKYSGKLWKFWMTQESGSNFCKDVMNREGEASPIVETIKHFTVGGDFTTSTIFNFVNGLLPTPKNDWAVAETEKLRQQMLDKLGNNGVLLYPSAPFPASYHHAAYLRPWNFNLFSIWNVLKFPVTQVPMGLGKDGLPLGIQVVAAPYQDRLCLAVAKELERAFGGYVPPFQTQTE
ncbi:fatty-acid amide hydrolase 2-A isoform X2 [Leptinotarsa decemlineata]|uniref:fatty-acid amide hydrolase 2-A isoform X2 n=1 Tax=Leptinotarsa decemlineata TaxID=7539 RepID=UPI003D306072